MTTGFDRLREDLSKIGDPECKHVLENGSSAYEWAIYGIEYIKTCSICCDLDYSSRTLHKPELGENISINALIDKLTGDIETVSALKDVRSNPETIKVVNRLLKEIEDLKSALLSRGVDIAKYIKTGEDVIRE